jgi:hypothetical protein
MIIISPYIFSQNFPFPRHEGSLLFYSLVHESALQVANGLLWFYRELKMFDIIIKRILFKM